MGEVEKHIMSHTKHRTTHLNGLLFALNGRNGPHAQVAAKSHVDGAVHAHRSGDASAGALLFDMKKRAVALKKAGEYVIDRHGAVVHRGPKLH
jgi:hypothetical protein